VTMAVQTSYRIALWTSVALLVSSATSVTAAVHAKANEFSTDLRSAVALYQRRQYMGAERILSRLLHQAPNSYQANELMGLVCAAQHNPEEAERYLSKAIELEPSSPQAHMFLAANLAQLHLAAQAEQEFRKAVTLAPRSFQANHNLGEFYIRSGRLNDAIGYLIKAQQIEPSSYSNGYDLALAEIDAGKYEQARLELHQLLAIRNTPDLHSLLGTVDEQSGRYIPAAKQMELAAQMNPSEANIFAWGLELLRHQAFPPAVEIFSAGAHRYPSSARMYLGLGIAHFAETNYSEAIDSFCRAIDLNPDDPRPYFFLAKIYDIAPTETPTVSARFRRFAQVQPDNPQALYYYALSLWKASRNVPAAAQVQTVKSLLDRAVALRPRYAEPHLLLGLVFAQEKEDAAAIKQYREALVSDPSLEEAHYELGEALMRDGDTKEAQGEFAVFTKLRKQESQRQDQLRHQIPQFLISPHASAGEP
jgi:Flp pilus assembly protein TadD